MSDFREAMSRAGRPAPAQPEPAPYTTPPPAPMHDRLAYERKIQEQAVEIDRLRRLVLKYKGIAEEVLF